MITVITIKITHDNPSIIDFLKLYFRKCIDTYCKYSEVEIEHKNVQR